MPAQGMVGFDLAARPRVVSIVSCLYTLLHQRFVYLESNAVNKALCYRRVFLVANSVHRDIRDNAV